MKRSLKTALGAGCLMAYLIAFPAAASAEQHHVHHGTRGAGGAVIYAYPYPYDWDWWGWDGFWGPFYNEPYGGYYQAPEGTVKLERVDKDDQVYVNGSLAGDAGHLKKMHLRPGSYSIEIKHDGTDVVHQQVYVTDGKTVKLTVGDKPAH